MNQQQTNTVSQAVYPTQYQRPAWAFAKPGQAARAASLMGVPHHMCMVDHGRMTALLVDGMATNARAYAILSRVNPARTQAVHITADINKGTRGARREELRLAIRSFRGLPYTLYSNNKLVLQMAREEGVLIYAYTAKDLDMNDVPFTCLYLCNEQGTSCVANMVNAIFKGRRIAIHTY